MRRSDRGSPHGHAVARRRDAGYVTAETAVVVPSLVAVVGMLLWGLMAAAGTIQALDGARAGARAAARGEPPAVVRDVARAVAPEGARVVLSRDGDLVRVRIEARTAGPGPLALPVEGEAVALAEESLARPAAAPATPRAAGRWTAVARPARGGVR